MFLSSYKIVQLHHWVVIFNIKIINIKISSSLTPSSPKSSTSSISSTSSSSLISKQHHHHQHRQHHPHQNHQFIFDTIHLLNLTSSQIYNHHIASSISKCHHHQHHPPQNHQHVENYYQYQGIQASINLTFLHIWLSYRF